MKRYIITLMLTLPAILLLAQKNETPYLTKSLSADAISAVKVETSGGSISVSGTSGSDARIEVYVRANNSNGKDISKEELQARLDKYSLDITVSDHKVTAIAKPKERKMDWKKSVSISFKVFVPEKVSTDLTTSGGSISLSNISGEQDFVTSGGSLKVDGVSGDIKGTTSGGSISVSNSKDNINLSTSGGSIDANNCEGKITLTTSCGSLSLKSLKGKITSSTSGGSIKGTTIDGDLSASTAGGSIDLDNLTCNLQSATSGGSIHVEMKELRDFVRLSNSGGHIDLEIPSGKGVDLDLAANKVRAEKLSNFDGTVKENIIKGKLNGGGTDIRVDGGGGRITLEIK